MKRCEAAPFASVVGRVTGSASERSDSFILASEIYCRLLASADYGFTAVCTSDSFILEIKATTCVGTSTAGRSAPARQCAARRAMGAVYLGSEPFLRTYYEP